MSDPGSVLFRDVEVDGVRTDVVVDGGTVRDLAPGLVRPPGVDEVDGRGGALLPGLHDHHVHLAALAAATASVRVGPPDVTSVEDLASALTEADRNLPAGAWLRPSTRPRSARRSTRPCGRAPASPSSLPTTRTC